MAVFLLLPFGRYLLFNYPLLSAMVGISTNFIFLSLLFILSYMRLLLKVEWGPEQVRGEAHYYRERLTVFK